MEQSNKHFITLSNGINLYTNSFTDTAQNWAVNHWGIKNARVFLSDDGKNKSYLLVVGQVAEYETQSYEQLSCYIDAYALANGFEQLSGWATVR